MLTAYKSYDLTGRAPIYKSKNKANHYQLNPSTSSWPTK